MTRSSLNARRYAALVRRYAGLIVLVCGLITALAVTLASGLSISTDLSALLPRGYRSVEDLHRLMKRIGGSASLTVAIESPNLKANERFADDLVARLRAHLPGQIANIDYKVDAMARFYEEHAAVYLGLPDLRAIEHDLDQATEKAKLDASPVPYDLGLDDAPARETPEQALEKIDKRIRAAQHELDRFPDGYYAGEGGKLLAVFVRPRSSGSDPKVARAFIANVQTEVDALGPSRYDPHMKVEYTGAYQTSLDEQAAIVHDLASTAALCIGLIALVVVAYFRRVRVLGLLGATLVCGCAWAFGLARLTVGYLNIQTAFLGSIIAGTGINYGIILLARYLEERRRGRNLEEALAESIGSTVVATLTAAATTAISFGTLLIARTSSFKHFAIIGGGGILFCWLLSFSLLPALLVLSERVRATVRREDERRPQWPEWLASLPVLHPRLCVAVALGLSLAGGIGFVRFLPHALETDARNLRNRSSFQSGAAKLDDRVSKIRGESMTPGFVVTDSVEQARQVCAVLDARIAREGEAAPISKCRSIFSLLPDHQTEKLAIAARILDRLDAIPDKALDPALQKRIARLRAHLELEPVTLASLPEELVRPFREVSGQVGRLVAVYPPDHRDLWIESNLFQFTDQIRKIDLGNGHVVTTSGDTVIFADILRAITSDAPRTTGLALIGVIAFVAFALRGRGTLHVVSALAVGVAWMVGVQAALGVKLNFFNFVALPTTFGIAVDYAINVYARYRLGVESGESRERAMHESLRSTGGAVFLCSLTTIIGYATLIIADNLALVSFGKLAIIGEACCVAASLLVLPALIMIDRRA